MFCVIKYIVIKYIVIKCQKYLDKTNIFSIICYNISICYNVISIDMQLLNGG